nr:MAG TPA: hypothetical protein [Caudoviricetes sp.]
MRVIILPRVRNMLLINNVELNFLVMVCKHENVR